jgi:protein-tyrosine kinase
MSIIEQATKRLEELNRAGIDVPWEAAGLANSELAAQVESARRAAPRVALPVAAVAHLFEKVTAPNGEPAAAVRPEHRAGRASRAVTLDLDRLAREGYLVPGQLPSLLAEEFRQIKRPLLRNARAAGSATERQSLIMVTSALPGEGKTFSAINLAISIAAEIDTAVLLVDADVVRPGVLQSLGVEADAGLLDLLSDPRLGLDELVLQTNIPTLSILPAGRRHPLSTELLASAAMNDLLVSLATGRQGRIVVFDTPPLLVTSEAKVLATRVGQVVMVVEAERTESAAVAQAFAALEQCRTVMSILNRAVEPKVTGRAYGYLEP